MHTSKDARRHQTFFFGRQHQSFPFVHNKTFFTSDLVIFPIYHPRQCTNSTAYSPYITISARVIDRLAVVPRKINKQQAAHIILNILLPTPLPPQPY